MNKLEVYFTAARAFVWGVPWRKYVTCGLLGVVATLLAQCAFATEITLPPKPTPTTIATADAGANAEAAAKSSSGGNTLSVVESNPRQAPALAQGGLYLAGCGFSGNAGDSNSHGASFLGIQFITPGCWDQMTIQNEARMGNVKTACEMNRLTRQGRRNLKRLRKAGVEVEPCPSGIVPAPDLSGYVTKEQLDLALLRVRYAEQQAQCQQKPKECGQEK